MSALTRLRRSAVLAASTLAISSACSFALAEDAKINEAIFDVTPTPFAAIVKVISNNGEKWNSIQPTEIAFDARIKIDTKGSGYIEQYAVFLGNCSNPSCGSHPKVLWEPVMFRDMDRSGTIKFSSSMLLGVDSGGISGTYVNTIISRCNQRPVTEAHGFRLPVDASMSANTRKAVAVDSMTPPEAGVGFAGGDVNRHGAFEIQVECVPITKTSEATRPDPHRTKADVTKLDLFLATIAQPASSSPRAPSGTQCKPIKVTTRIETDKSGPKNVKLWRQVNSGPITSESKQLHASELAAGTFGDDWIKFEQFSQTTTLQYKAEVLGGAFSPSTPWKSITIHCNGDYAAPQSDANPDNGDPPRGRPNDRVSMPPVIVTPPPSPCASGKVARRGASSPCIKVAPLPDRRQQIADAKRKDAAERHGKVAREREQHRRNVARRVDEDRRRHAETPRPALDQPASTRPMFGRPAFGGFMGPRAVGRGPVFGAGIMLGR